MMHEKILVIKIYIIFSNIRTSIYEESKIIKYINSCGKSTLYEISSFYLIYTHVVFHCKRSCEANSFANFCSEALTENNG